MADLNELLGQLEQGSALRHQQAAIARLYGMNPTVSRQDTGAVGQVASPDQRGVRNVEELSFPLGRPEAHPGLSTPEKVITGLGMAGQAASLTMSSGTR